MARPLSVSRRYQAYFSPQEVKILIDANRGKLSLTRLENLRQQVCGFIDKTGVQMGLPRKTVASAQVLYHRFSLFLSTSEYNYQEVSLAALLLACKLEDTRKKLHDIQLAGIRVRAFLDGVPVPNEPDAKALEQERFNIIGIERLMVETISFNFNIHSGGSSTGLSQRDVFGYLRRIGYHMKVPKRFAKLAFKIAIDVHRTLAPLSYPSHVLALSCLYLASFLDPSHPNCEAKNYNVKSSSAPTPASSSAVPCTSATAKNTSINIQNSSSPQHENGAPLPPPPLSSNDDENAATKNDHIIHSETRNHTNNSNTIVIPPTSTTNDSIAKGHNSSNNTNLNAAQPESFTENEKPPENQQMTKGTPNVTKEQLPSFPPEWEKKYFAYMSDIEEICHLVLDLYISSTPSHTIPGPSPANSSPAEPPHHPYHHHTSQAQPSNATASTTMPSTSSNSQQYSQSHPPPQHSSSQIDYTHIKIRLREVQEELPSESQNPKRRRRVDGSLSPLPHTIDTHQSQYLGKDDVTIRFIF